MALLLRQQAEHGSRRNQDMGLQPVQLGCQAGEPCQEIQIIELQPPAMHAGVEVAVRPEQEGHAQGQAKEDLRAGCSDLRLSNFAMMAPPSGCFPAG